MIKQLFGLLFWVARWALPGAVQTPGKIWRQPDSSDPHMICQMFILCDTASSGGEPSPVHTSPHLASDGLKMRSCNSLRMCDL